MTGTTAGDIFITGGSGFVGQAVIDELLARGDGVRALVHRRPLPERGPRLASVQADLLDAEQLRQAMAGCAAVIHLVGIIREAPRRGVTFQRMHIEATRALVDAARMAQVRRYLHMSALGARADAASEYHRTKYAAEQYVRASGLEWTILRPSLIHGPGGEFMQMEAAWAKGKAMPYLFMPYFGRGLLGRGGAGKLQPVHVKDVARAFADALTRPQSIGRTYGLGGADQLTWPQLHRLVCEAITGRPRPVLPIPVWYARLLTSVVPKSLLPFNRDQVVMSQEDNTCDLSQFERDFGWAPQAFEPSLRSYAADLR